MLHFDLEPWLGRTASSEFESLDEIERYFDIDNLVAMFPQDGEIDEDESERAKDETIRQWRESKGE